jgi:hypothetical protein
MAIQESLFRKPAFFFRNPEFERIAAAVDGAEIEIARREGNQQKDKPVGSWLAAAKEGIARAKTNFNSERKIQAAWRELKAAERAMLEDPTDKVGAESVAITLRREAETLEGRRGKAIVDLLCDDKGILLPDISDHRARIIQAAALRDDYFDTQYYRIELRRRHLMNLFILLLVALTALLTFSYFNMIELFAASSVSSSGKTFNGFSRLLTVLLLGTLGASLSVAQTIVTTDINTKITVQRVGAFMVWMRPIIGATAAVIAYALLSANTDLKIFFEGKYADNLAVVAVIAIVAGFSERFIVGALNTIADSQAKK